MINITLKPNIYTRHHWEPLTCKWAPLQNFSFFMIWPALSEMLVNGNRIILKGCIHSQRFWNITPIKCAFSIIMTKDTKSSLLLSFVMVSMLSTQTPQTTTHSGFSSLWSPKPSLHTQCIQILQWFWFLFHACHRSDCSLFHAFNCVHCTIYVHLVLWENLILYKQANSCFCASKNINMNKVLYVYTILQSCILYTIVLLNSSPQIG